MANIVLVHLRTGVIWRTAAKQLFALKIGSDGGAETSVRNTIRPVSYTHLDVYKRQNQDCMQKIIWFCLNLRWLSFDKKKITLDKKKALQVNYPFPLPALHQKQ